MIRLDITAPQWAHTLLNDIERALARLEYPNESKRPVRLPEFSDETDLPDPAEWRSSVIYVKDGSTSVSILCFSDGTSWRRSDTGNIV